MTTSRRFLIGSLVLVGAVAYLIYAGVQQSGVYYVTLEEFRAQQATLAGEGIRIAGRVAPGSVTKKMTPNGEELTFSIGDFVTDGAPKDTVRVHYLGITPDMFKAEGGSDVIVEGKYRDGMIYAQSVMTSCPSKYEAEAEYEAEGAAAGAAREG
jgi:cytochrome c-type biogenesis protein CcmE